MLSSLFLLFGERWSFLTEYVGYGPNEAVP